MDRSHARVAAANRIVALLLGRHAAHFEQRLPGAVGHRNLCLEGGNLVPAECDGLKGERVVVMCKPPSSNEYRHAGRIAQRRRQA